MPDLVSGDDLEVLAGAAAGGELNAGVEDDVGLDDLPGEASGATVAVALARAIGSGRDGNRKGAGILGEVGVGTNEADEVHVGRGLVFGCDIDVRAFSDRERSVWGVLPCREGSGDDVVNVAAARNVAPDAWVQVPDYWERIEIPVVRIVAAGKLGEPGEGG